MTDKPAKPYFILLFLIAAAISIFYYFYLKSYGGLYCAHYYEYYTKAVVITDLLKKLDLPTAYLLYLDSFPDKILIYRPAPFLMAFGSSQFTFFYSSVLFNMLLLVILFHSLLKIMRPESAFVLTFFILSQYFFIELLASFYVDLSFFLLCSIFFIYLSVFDKAPEKYNIRLALMVFLLFLVKNVSYPLMAVSGLLLTIYFLIAKKNRWAYIWRFWVILACGFLIYYLVALAGDLKRLVWDLDHANTNTDFGAPENLLLAIYKSFTSFRFSDNYIVMNKSPFWWINILIYQIVIYMAYKKREVFWLIMFLVSEMFYVFFYNIQGHQDSEYRHFLAFYFVYIYFIYGFLTDIFNKLLPRINANVVIFSLASVLFLTGFVRLADPEKRVAYSGQYNYKYCTTDDFSRHLPLRSKVYLAEDADDYGCFYASFIDYEDYSYLAAVDRRFGYRFVRDMADADFVLCKDCSNLELKNAIPLATAGTLAGKYKLFKIK